MDQLSCLVRTQIILRIQITAVREIERTKIRISIGILLIFPRKKPSVLFGMYQETNSNLRIQLLLTTFSTCRLESDIKRLKADLQCSRQTEQELRNQINNLISADKITQQEMNQLQQDNDNLQNKYVTNRLDYWKLLTYLLIFRLHNLVTAKQNDRSTINSLERKLGEERRLRQAAESQVSQLERRNKKLEEQSQSRAQALANAK